MPESELPGLAPSNAALGRGRAWALCRAVQVVRRSEVGPQPPDPAGPGQGQGPGKAGMAVSCPHDGTRVAAKRWGQRPVTETQSTQQAGQGSSAGVTGLPGTPQRPRSMTHSDLCSRDSVPTEFPPGNEHSIPMGGRGAAGRGRRGGGAEASAGRGWPNPALAACFSNSWLLPGCTCAPSRPT